MFPTLVCRWLILFLLTEHQTPFIYQDIDTTNILLPKISRNFVQNASLPNVEIGVYSLWCIKNGIVDDRFPYIEKSREKN